MLEVAGKARKRDLDLARRELERPFKVSGVGTGVDSTNVEAKLPIALKEETGNVSMFTFHAPTVSGSGSSIPALLGLDSMSKQKGVLEMTACSEHLTFPGPNGYTIDRSEGTKRFKLIRAPSGHLILLCDNYDMLREQGHL